MFEMHAETQDLFQLRIAELLLQLSLVAIVGGVVKLLIDWGAAINSRYRDMREQRIDFLRRVRDVSVRVNYAQDLLNAHNSGKTYGERLRDIMLLRGEVVEIIEDLKAHPDLFREQATIEGALADINSYLDGGRQEYIQHHDEVGADACKGEKIQISIDRLDMKWVSDFMSEGIGYRTSFFDKLGESKGKMRQQVHGPRAKS